jgi:hypothetical protein
VAFLLAWPAATWLLIRLVGTEGIVKGRAGPDFICYWAAGSIVASGGNPYSVSEQTRIQQGLGWDRVKDGLGLYDFLPFYYPPWFALPCAALTPLGFPAAKAAWLALNAVLLIAAARLLRGCFPGVPRRVAAVAIVVFIFSWASAMIGQTTPLVFVTVAAAWRLILARRDRLAGLALAWLTIKPQLTGLLVLGVLIWSARQRRWGVSVGFVAAMAGFAAISFAMQPDWLVVWLRSTRETPPPTEYFPWIGTTWFLVLKGVGLTSWKLWIPYLAISLPFLALLARTSWRRSTDIADVLALTLLASYVVAPYGRHYDFPVLLIPLLLLVGRRKDLLGATLLFAMLVVPYCQYQAFPTIKRWLAFTGSLNPEITFAWIPALLCFAWLIQNSKTTLANSEPVEG